MEKIIRNLLKRGEIDLTMAVYSETVYKISFPFMKKTVVAEGENLLFCLKKAYEILFEDYYENSINVGQSFLRELEFKLIKGCLINAKELLGTIHVSITETGVPRRNLSPGTYKRKGQGNSFKEAFENALTKEFAFVS